MDLPFLPYGRQSIGDAEKAAVRRVLDSDWLTTGPEVRRFEEAVVEATGARYAVAVSSGTAALHLACLAAGFGPGDEVLVPALTFAASANAILYAGATPVFVDSRDADGLIDPARAQERIGPRTRGLVGVDYAGHPCDWDALRELARRHGLVTIDDACHALGAEFRGRRVGGFADFTILSFHPVKHITTGEGGMVLAEDAARAHRVESLRNHGMEKERFLLEDEEKGPWYYEIQHLGFNYRISDFQCALGREQLGRLPAFLSRRRELAARYRRLLDGTSGLGLPAESEGVRSAWHLYVVRVPAERRREIFLALRERGIGVQVHYLPVHLHPLYRRRFGTGRGLCPVAERFYDEAVSLPLFPAMRDEDADRVARALREILACLPAGEPGGR